MLKITISAGILYFAWISKTSPTFIFAALIILIVFPFIALYRVEFDYLSLLYLLKSSYAYFPKVSTITMIKGDKYVNKNPNLLNNYRLLKLVLTEKDLLQAGKN